MTNARKPLVPALFALLAAAAPARAQTSTWRPVVAADHGMIASGHPLASEAGLVEPVGIALSPSDPRFQDLVENYLGALERTGVLEELRRRWLEESDWISALP